MKNLAKIIYTIFLIKIALVSCGCNMKTTVKPQENESKDENITQKTIHLSVTNITCHPCVNAVKRKLLSIKGIESVDVYLEQEDKNVKVIYQPSLTSIATVKAAIEETGRQVVNIKED